MHTHKSTAQPRWFVSLMALVILVMQSSYVFASMSMDLPNDKTPCHEVAMQHEQHGDNTAQSSQCQQNCCEDNSCATQCSHCVVVTAGILMHSFKQMHPSSESQLVELRTDQYPSGSDPTSLYRPPRTSI